MRKKGKRVSLLVGCLFALYAFASNTYYAVNDYGISENTNIEVLAQTGTTGSGGTGGGTLGSGGTGDYEDGFTKVYDHDGAEEEYFAECDDIERDCRAGATNCAKYIRKTPFDCQEKGPESKCVPGVKESTLTNCDYPR